MKKKMRSKKGKTHVRKTKRIRGGSAQNNKDAYIEIVEKNIAKLEKEISILEGKPELDAKEKKSLSFSRTDLQWRKVQLAKLKNPASEEVFPYVETTYLNGRTPNVVEDERASRILAGKKFESFKPLNTLVK